MIALENLTAEFKRNNRYLDISSINIDETTSEIAGMHPKFWFEVNGDKYLAKFDRFNHSNYGEMIYNSLAKQVIEQDSIVDYDFVLDKQGRHGVACKNFLKDDEILLSGYEFILRFSNKKELEIKSLGSFYFSLGKEFNNIEYLNKLFHIAYDGDEEKVRESLSTLFKMFVLDTLCNNTDRSLSNWGVIVDKQSGKVKRLAPVFDNGHILGLGFNGDREVIFEELRREQILHFYKDANIYKYKTREELISIFKCEDKFYRDILKDILVNINFETAMNDLEDKIHGEIDLANIAHIKKEFNKNLRYLVEKTIAMEEKLNKIYKDYDNGVVLSEEAQLEILKIDNKLIRYIVNPTFNTQLEAVSANYNNLVYTDKEDNRLKKAAINNSYKALSLMENYDEELLMRALNKSDNAISYVRDYTPRVSQKVIEILTRNPEYYKMLDNPPQEILNFVKNERVLQPLIGR